MLIHIIAANTDDIIKCVRVDPEWETVIGPCTGTFSPAE